MDAFYAKLHSLYTKAFGEAVDGMAQSIQRPLSHVFSLRGTSLASPCTGRVCYAFHEQEVAMKSQPITRRGAIALAGLALAGCTPTDDPDAGDRDNQGPTLTPLDGKLTKDWDAAYYVPAFETTDEAREASEQVAVQVQAEGMVLLHNRNKTLPIEPKTRISLVGRSAIDTIFGGTGAAGIDMDSCMSLIDGIEDAGLKINTIATRWIKRTYEDYPRGAVGRLDQPSTVSSYIGEIPWDEYPEDVRESLDDTICVVVLGRTSGEGDDLSTNLLYDLHSGESDTFVANAETENYVQGQHQLELTVEELSLLAGVKERAKRMIVLLNCATTMQLGPLVERGGDYEADAIVQIGFPGAVGAKAVGQMLTGEVNPSGRTCDTWAVDFRTNPTMYNFGNHTYTDIDSFYTQLGSGAHFVEYEEGIYVGYRWYETADTEGFLDYDKAVVFPFGYGLSYTEFDRVLDDVSVDSGNVIINVTVTNTGSRAGKDVVEAYFTAPWEPGMPEKSSVVLAAFAKTELLEPNDSQELVLSWPLRQMASWNTTLGAFVLDEGSYEISLRSDSHTVIDSRKTHVPQTVYGIDSSTGQNVVPRFSDMDLYLARNCTLLSRENFTETFPTKRKGNRVAADCGLTLAPFDASTRVDLADEMPILRGDFNLELIDLRGQSPTSPLWELLLDQLSVEDMTTVVANNVYGNPRLRSVGKPETVEPDGPAGFAYMNATTGHAAYPSGYIQSQTWNTDLMRTMGEAVGEEALAAGYCGWCAPAINLHRSPFGGRTFEYLSEDPTLAGKMACGIVEGAASKGVYCQCKHFCLNEQDTNRCWHLLTWAPEQAVRELYARPWEIVIKEARCELPLLDPATGERKTVLWPAATAVMSSYNFVGATWAGGRESLVTGLLRDEWGFAGYVVSDWSFYDYMEKNQAIYAGTDVNFTTEGATGEMADTQSATAVLSMRRAMQHYLFTVANSNAMNGLVPTVLVEG